MKKILFLLTFLLAVFPLFPQVARAEYTMGIVGYGNRVKHTNIPVEALEQAQKIFSDILNTELVTIQGVTILDPSERATQARIEEMCFQLDLGNPSSVISDFSVHPDYLVYGYLTNFTITRREAMLSQNYTVRSDFTVRILNASTGQVVATASGTGITETHGANVAKDTLEFSDISQDSWCTSVEDALTVIGKKLRKKV